LLGAVDAVLIALPHHLHHEAGLSALEAGKHVLMEKPLANTESECLDLIAAAEAAGRVLMIGYCMRFDPMVLAFKRHLDERTCGDCFQLSIWTEQHTDLTRGEWIGQADKVGGGQLFSHGCHYIDLLMWMLGDPIRGTHTGTNTGTPWMEMEGTSNVAMTFPGDRLGCHFGTWGARGSRLKYSFQAHCTEGLLDCRYSEGKLLAIRGSEEELLLENPPGKSTAAEMAHFIDCVETGAEPLTNAPDSLAGLRVIWRLYEAERAGVVADLSGLALKRH
jgi:predicted dehydrogenase